MQKFDLNESDMIDRVFAQNRHAFAFLNQRPIVPGHTLICPKQAISVSDQFTPEIWADILKLKTAVCTKLKNFLGAKAFNLAWNEGLIAGQTVAHFHLHVVPRHENDSGITEYE